MPQCSAQIPADGPSLPKHRKCESHHSFDSDSSCLELEKVVLTPEEEEEFRQLYSCPELVDFTSDSSGSPSPPRNNDEVVAQCTETDPVHLHFMRSSATKASETTEPLYIRLRHKILHYLTTTGKDKSELLATSSWDKTVFKIFDVKKCIVHPNYFFASDAYPRHTVSSFLEKMEHSNMQGVNSWSYVKKELESFYQKFEGFDNLANAFHLDGAALELKGEFDEIDLALQHGGSLNSRNQGWYQSFKDFKGDLQKEGSHGEATFQEYIELLFQQLNCVTSMGFPTRREALELVLPAQKAIPDKKVLVMPDIMVRGKNPMLMLVGKVKPFGLRGVKNVEHQGRKVRQIQPDVSNVRLMRRAEPDTGQLRGQGDQVPPAVNENEKSVRSLTTGEPRASTSNDTDQPRRQGDQLPTTVNEKDKLFSSVTTDEPHTSTSNDTGQPQGQGDQLPPTVNEKEKSVPSDEPSASTSRDTGQPRGQGDQLPPTVNEREKSIPSLTSDEPRASTSREKTESDKSAIPRRPLDSKEEYKVDKYLPQLFGQMLAAMQKNETDQNTSAYRFRRFYENVQFGFAVEGFKLRFVKLVMIDILKKQKPTVGALLSGESIKCYISMTQELNLLKRHHLEMFYQILLAMRYLCW